MRGNNLCSWPDNFKATVLLKHAITEHYRTFVHARELFRIRRRGTTQQVFARTESPTSACQFPRSTCPHWGQVRPHQLPSQETSGLKTTVHTSNLISRNICNRSRHINWISKFPDKFPCTRYFLDLTDQIFGPDFFASNGPAPYSPPPPQKNAGKHSLIVRKLNHVNYFSPGGNNFPVQ
jgi:hypothetical protein